MLEIGFGSWDMFSLDGMAPTRLRILQTSSTRCKRNSSFRLGLNRSHPLVWIGSRPMLLLVRHIHRPMCPFIDLYTDIFFGHTHEDQAMVRKGYYTRVHPAHSGTIPRSTIPIMQPLRVRTQPKPWDGWAPPSHPSRT
jgi:hypothetical protein